jgi:hypothetical protein
MRLVMNKKMKNNWKEAIVAQILSDYLGLCERNNVMHEKVQDIGSPRSECEPLTFQIRGRGAIYSISELIS